MTPELKKAITDFFQANFTDPSMVIFAMVQYGIGGPYASIALNQPQAFLRRYLDQAGAAPGFGGLQPDKIIEDHPSDDQRAFVEWQVRQPNFIGGGTIGDTLKANNTSPYCEANLRLAQEQIDQIAGRNMVMVSRGLPLITAPWLTGEAPVVAPVRVDNGNFAFGA